MQVIGAGFVCVPSDWNYSPQQALPECRLSFLGVVYEIGAKVSNTVEKTGRSIGSEENQSCDFLISGSPARPYTDRERRCPERESGTVVRRYLISGVASTGRHLHRILHPHLPQDKTLPFMGSQLSIGSVMPWQLQFECYGAEC